LCIRSPQSRIEGHCTAACHHEICRSTKNMLHSAHCSMLADRDILCCNLVLSKTLNCLTSMNLLQAVCQTVHSRIRLPCFRYRSWRIWSASSRPRSVSVELPLCRSAASLGNCEAYGTQEARRNTARLPAASEDWRRENRRRNTSHLSLTSMRQRPKYKPLCIPEATFPTSAKRYCLGRV